MPLKGILMKSTGVLAFSLAVLAAGCAQNNGPLVGLTPSQSDNAATTQLSTTGRSSLAAKASYLYASTRNVDVTLYSYPQLSQLGRVSDSSAAGMCADNDGNVYVAESGTSELTEYQAGTLTPMRTIDDTNYAPVSCAINPKNGDLAVTNSAGMVGGKSKPGSIALFEKATGSPKIYKNRSINSFAYCGYDQSGNLYVDGLASKGGFVLAELNGSKLTSLGINWTIAQPGAVAWDSVNKALLVNDTSGFLYRFYVYNDYAHYSNYTALNGALSLGSNVSFKGKFVAAATSSQVAVWAFPSGDGPKYYFNASNIVGIAFSTTK